MMVSFLLLAAGTFLFLTDSEENDAGEIGEDLWWEVQETTLYIHGTGPMINPKDVSFILDYSWYYEYRDYVKYIVMDEGITTLEDGCFCGFNNLMGEINIPKSVEKIGKEVFKSTDISKVTIAEGSNLKSIGESAFENCPKLKTFNLPEGLKSIGYAAFRNCTSLTDTLKFPSTLTSIGYYAFENCSNLKGSIEIPNAVSSLSGCFKGCSSLTGELKLPSTLGYIGPDTFSGCSGITGTVKLNHQYCFGIYESAFKDCVGITEVDIKGNIMCSIWSDAFEGCTGLTSFKILQGDKIYDGAFNGCTNLTKMTFGKLETISPSAFEGIEFYDEDGKKIELTEETVKELNGYVFEGSNSKLTKVAQTDEEIPDKEDESSGGIDVWMIATPVAFIAGVLVTMLAIHFRKP